jgi:hypothetical protein
VVVLWVSRPHLSMDNSLRCPWGLHLTYRYILLRARVTADGRGCWSGLGLSALSGHGDGSPTRPGARFGCGSSGCTFLVVAALERRSACPVELVDQICP